jgi:hypothetical protein
MKRFPIIATLAVLLLGAATPSAHAIGVMASWWNIDKENTDGFGFGLRQEVPITPLFALHTDASWLKFSKNGNDTNVFPLEASAVARLGLFYGGLGLGYYIFDTDGTSIDNNFGWFAKAGVHVGLAKVGVFGEIKYTKLSADFKDVKPGSGLPTSLDADGVGFNVGVMLGL